MKEYILDSCDSCGCEELPVDAITVYEYPPVGGLEGYERQLCDYCAQSMVGTMTEPRSTAHGREAGVLLVQLCWVLEKRLRA